MKSEWFTQRNPVAGEDLFIAARVRDISKIVHSGNLEHYGKYESDRSVVDEIVRKLNSGELQPEEEADLKKEQDQPSEEMIRQIDLKLGQRLATRDTSEA